MRKSRPFLHAALVSAMAPAASAQVTAAPVAVAEADVHFVSMEEIQAPIVDGGRAHGVLRVKIVLETSDSAGAERLTAALPIIRATSLAAAIEFARLEASPMMPVDAAQLATDMSAALQADRPDIIRVLIVEVAAVRT